MKSNNEMNCMLIVEGFYFLFIMAVIIVVVTTIVTIMVMIAIIEVTEATKITLNEVSYSINEKSTCLPLNYQNLLLTLCWRFISLKTITHLSSLCLNIHFYKNPVILCY